MRIRALFFTIGLSVQFNVYSSQFTVSGDEVTDMSSGLTWRRCAEGQVWNESMSICTGTALQFTHQQALMRAADQAKLTGKPWKVPNVKELGSIVKRGVVGAFIDTAAFPATPKSSFWASTPYAGSSELAWGVGFFAGDIGASQRGSVSHVRLVR